MGATTFVVPQVAGALITRVGERPFIVASMTLHAAAMTWIALVAEPDLPYQQMVIPLILSGAGVAMAMPATQSSVLSSVAGEDIGRASGAYSMLRQLGGAFGVAVLVAVFAGSGGYSSAREFTDGFAPAMGACAALALLGAATGLALRRRRRAGDREHAAAVAAIAMRAASVDTAAT